MKLKNYILCMAAIGILAGCSDNEPILDNPIQPGTALLSLSIDTKDLFGTKGMTKSDATIASLSVFVYDATSGVRIAGKTKTVNQGTLTEVDSIKVSPGNAKVLILANVDEEILTALETKNLPDVLATTTTLDSEETGSFTMSSVVRTVTLQEGKYNMMGYTNLQVGNTENGHSVYQEGNNPNDAASTPIKLYRTVARVQLMSVTVSDEGNKFGKTEYLHIDSVFLGNVKSRSYIASEKDYLQVEAENAKLSEAGWWYGAHADDEPDMYKSPVGGAVKDTATLAYKFEPLLELVPEVVYKNTDGSCLGKSFYVYENSNGGEGIDAVALRTYLVIRGTYSYTDELGTHTEPNRFYTVPINYPANVGTGTLREDAHAGIMRNNSYELHVTVQGKGSDKPWEPSQYINVNAVVKVAPWSGSVGVGGNLE